MSVRDDRCVCDAPRFFDADGDGYGAGEPLEACTMRPGIVALGGDCDDGDESRHPGAEETCNGLDDDCDGAVDEDFPCARGAAVACTTTCGSQGSMLCADSCALPEGAECSPPEEVCNGVDDDCDGAVDEGLRELKWLGQVGEGATLEAGAFGIPGGLIVTSRALTAATLLVLDIDGGRIRSDRSLDPNILMPKVASRSGGLVLRGVHDSSPTRPYCATLGPSPDFVVSSGFCAGELDSSTELLGLLTDGLYEVWLARVNGEIHAGVVNFGPAAIGPLTVDGAPLRGERAFGVSHLERFVIESEGKLRIYRRHASEPGRYTIEGYLGASIATSVDVGEGEVTIAQARTDHIVLRRYEGSFTCATTAEPYPGCGLGTFGAAVSVAGSSAISVERIGRLTFVAYTAEEGSALGFLELGEDDELVNHVAFAHAQGPFVEVFTVDVGERLPRVLARTSGGGLHLYSPECASE